MVDVDRHIAYWREGAQEDWAAEMNAFSQAGRYPETLSAAPTTAEADGYLTRATEVFEWLMSRL